MPHAKWGAGYARKFKINDVSIAIDGHHKGLPNRTDWKSDTNQIVNDDEPDFDEVKNAFLVDTGFDEISLASFCAPTLSGFQPELFIRYLFSALTDSDWLSTEEHFDAEK